MSEQYEIWKNAARDLKWALRLFIEDETGYAPHSAESDGLMDHYIDKAKKMCDSNGKSLFPDTHSYTPPPEPEYVKTEEEALVYYNLTSSLLNLYNAGIITKAEFREMLGL